MITSTESTSKIPVPKDIENEIVLVLQLEKYAKLLNEKLNSIIDGNQWIGVNDKDFYYIPEDELILPNTCKIKTNAMGLVQVNDHSNGLLGWKDMQRWVALKWFYDRKHVNPMVSEDNTIIYLDVDGNELDAEYVYCYDTKTHLSIYNAGEYTFSKNIDEGIKMPIYQLDESQKSNLLSFLIKYKLDLFDDCQAKGLFRLFIELNEQGLLEDIGEKNTFKINNVDDYNYVCDKLLQMGIEFNPDDSEYVGELSSDSYCLDDSVFEEIKNALLDCDKLRVNMETYPEHILQDPESGHWDLWDNGDSSLHVNTSKSLVARNPVYDALENKSGVVGIDFGTKSTVVMYRQSRADVLPMRIGSGQFSRAVSQNDYENPTVMELRNVEKFMQDYRQCKGRPNTCWEDLLISHEAAEQLKSEQTKGDTFAAFFSELKQWASDKTRQVRLRDLQGNEINIPSYLSLSEDDFDPIEIYAYYLGLFINNMVHKIYLRYKLSFPATVEKKVRDKILNSFTKGIRKSLPKQVLEDEKCMKIFKVEQGASEPAAYAITALSSDGYNFDPKEDEKYYYGIFDFGGGTTDFDFGVWSVEETEPDNYDYQISHFGQGGDPYLGGENLLGILSYHVFVNNYDKLLKDKIVFIRPSGEKEIAGKDYLVCQDSQYAHFNHKRMMEKLRGVWENNTETKDSLKSGSITLPLFTMAGELKDNYCVDVDLNEVDQLIESRIDEGVSQFFDALKNCFGVDKNQKDIHNVNGINIFLAGNSSKSPIVYKIFKKHIDSLKTKRAESQGEITEWFKLYPPLGTDIAYKIRHEELKPLVDDIISYFNKTEENDKDEPIDEVPLHGKDSQTEDEVFKVTDLNKPTGKTGVAYGLLNNRVRVVQNETNEIGFRYYIGQNRKNKFYCVIDKDNQEYHVWAKFCTASREDFDIWFTRSAAAPSNKMPIDQIGVYSEPGFVSEPSAEKAVYIRLISPTEIEYVVASEEEINNSTYAEELVERVSLQEKQ